MSGRCQDAVPLLGALNDGGLDSRERSQVEAHLDGCAACGARRTFLAAQGHALRQRMAARTDQVDFTFFAAKVMARVAADKETRKSWFDRALIWLGELSLVRRMALGAGAGLSAAAALTLVVLPVVRHSTSGSKVLASATQRAHAPDGDQSGEAEIEDLEVFGEEGVVLQAPGQSTLIWVTEPSEGAQ